MVANKSFKSTAIEHDVNATGTNSMRINKGWSCSTCDMKTNSYGSLKKHQAIHGERTHLCHHCDKAFKIGAHLKEHIEAKHEVTKNCSICDFKASTKRNLDKHVVMKHFNESLICTKCSFKTSDRPAMNVHEKRIHGSRDDWIKCAECNHKSYNKKP